MSIVACVNVHDAVVFGSDSITTITGVDAQGTVVTVKSYRHAQKLYQLSEHVAVATWGAGNIGPRSIKSFVEEFGRGLTMDDQKPVRDVAEALLTHTRDAYLEHYDGQTPTEIGFMVGGYSPDVALAEVLEFTLPNSVSPQSVRADDQFGASWRGVAVPFARLCNGIDPQVASDIHSELEQAEASPELRSRIASAMQGRSSPFVFDGMPIQEAVDFVAFILQTTINAAKFEAGLQSCGGPLWVSAITKDGFQWVAEARLWD